MQKLHVIFAIDRAGIVGADGETHQGVFDIAYLSHIPNMTLLSPKNKWELQDMLDFAIQYPHTIAIRYPRGTASEQFEKYRQQIVYGKSEVIQYGEKVALLAEGHMIAFAMEAAEKLKQQNINAVHFDICRGGPLSFIKKLKKDNKNSYEKNYVRQKKLCSSLARPMQCSFHSEAVRSAI